MKNMYGMDLKAKVTWKTAAQLVGYLLLFSAVRVAIRYFHG